MITHDGDDDQGHPGHLLWVSLHQAAEHSERHTDAAASRWEPPPFDAIRPSACPTPDQRMR